MGEAESWESYCLTLKRGKHLLSSAEITGSALESSAWSMRPRLWDTAVPEQPSPADGCHGVSVDLPSHPTNEHFTIAYLPT